MNEADELIYRLQRLTSQMELHQAAQAVEVFRTQSTVHGPIGDQRARVTIELAAAYLRFGDTASAAVWALRTLQGGPRADAFELLGRIARDVGDVDQAAAWWQQIATMSSTPAVRKAWRDATASVRVQTRPLRTVQHRVKVNDGHVLALMTCAGRETTLHRTLSSIERAGLHRWSGPKFLLVDGTELNIPVHEFNYESWHVRVCGPLRSQAKMLLKVFETAADIPTMTALTLVEDDVVFAENALDYIAATEIDPDLALLSWFTSVDHVEPLTPFLCVTPAQHYHPTNQAITFPASTVHEVLASRRLHDWPTPHGADAVFLDVPGKPCALHYPNLAQHVGGNESMVGNTGARLSPTFIGEDADALDLI